MKKSTFIKLVLVSSVAASCSQPKENNDWSSETGKKKVYMRSDTSAHYARSRSHLGGLLFFAFRPYGSILGSSGYRRMGYYSNAISHSANVGGNSSKSGLVSRGGFGRTGRTVSS
jgi:hypothetical protein